MNNTSLSFTSFTESILTRLREELGDSYTVFSKIVNKNNGVRRTGIIIRKEGQNTFPTVYIDGFYSGDMTRKQTEEIALSILQEFRGAELTEEVDLSDFIAFERAGEKLAFKLVNAEKKRAATEGSAQALSRSCGFVLLYGAGASLLWKSGYPGGQSAYETVGNHSPGALPEGVCQHTRAFPGGH